MSTGSGEKVKKVKNLRVKVSFCQGAKTVWIANGREEETGDH